MRHSILTLGLMLWSGGAALAPAASHEAMATNEYPSWTYPMVCCSDGDCFAVEDADINELEDGAFEIVPTGQIVDGRKVHVSEDGRYHVCTGKLKDFTVPVKCLFVPPRGF